MATAWFSTNTELGLINALNESLTLYLPNDAPQGKNLFVKDAAGNSPQSTITLTTQGLDTFENGSLIQTINSAYESIQLNYNTNKWYITGGTMFNTMRVSTLQAQTIRATNLSSLNISVSSFQISDLPTSTLGTFNTLSSILHYNGNSVGGGVRTAILQSLNSSRFSVYSIPGLAGWYDAADRASILLRTGTSVSQWTDKSGFRNSAIQTIVGREPQYNSGTNGIVFNGTTQYMLIPSNSIRQFNLINCFAVVNIPTIAGNYFNNIIRKGQGVLPITFEFYLRVLIQSGIPTVDAQIGYYTSVGFSSGQFPNTSYTFNRLELVGMFTNIRNGFTMTNGTLGAPFTLTSAQRLGPSVTGVGIRPLSSDGISISEYFNGTIHEIVVLNQEPTTAIRQQTEGYLAWKWGIQANLPASHPFRNAPPLQ
jgi:hypothetical protein